jgi:tyrosinase
MMKQAIFKVMLDIVDTKFGESDAYREAIQHFRLPYLDYYRPRGGTVSFPGAGIGGMTSFKYNFKLPGILVVEEVMVLKSAGDTTMSRIRNPLYSFVFEDPASRPSIIPDAQWDLITDRVV